MRARVWCMADETLLDILPLSQWPGSNRNIGIPCQTTLWGIRVPWKSDTCPRRPHGKQCCKRAQLGQCEQLHQIVSNLRRLVFQGRVWAIGAPFGVLFALALPTLHRAMELTTICAVWLSCLETSSLRVNYHLARLQHFMKGSSLIWSLLLYGMHGLDMIPTCIESMLQCGTNSINTKSVSLPLSCFQNTSSANAPSAFFAMQNCLFCRSQVLHFLFRWIGATPCCCLVNQNVLSLSISLPCSVVPVSYMLWTHSLTVCSSTIFAWTHRYVCKHIYIYMTWRNMIWVDMLLRYLHCLTLRYLW